VAVDRITRRVIVGYTLIVIVLCAMLPLAPDQDQDRVPKTRPDVVTPATSEKSAPTPAPPDPVLPRSVRPDFSSPSPPERVDRVPMNPMDMHGIDPRRMLLYRPEDLRRQPGDFEQLREQLRALPDRPVDRPIRQQ
jgi:hypothetical protein